MRKIFLASLFVAALVGCQKSSPDNTEQRPAEAPKEVVVAYTPQPQSTLVIVASANGYFSAEGLAVQLLAHSYGKLALQSVVGNQADFATVAETPVMFSIFNGDRISLIANINKSTMNNAVVARKDAGIAAPGDLKGKRIGFVPGTTGDFFLDSLLTANGLTRRDIEPVGLKPEDMGQAIMAKKVDAVSIWNYLLTQIGQQLGSDGITLYDREIYTETFNIVARQDFVRDHPETVKSFVRALLKAEDFVARNQEEAQAIMAAATKTDIGLVRDVWKAFNNRVAIDQTLLITLEDETRWAMKNKLTNLTAMPDYLTYIHLDSLKAIKPEAVRVHR